MPNHFIETTLNYVLTYIASVDKSRAEHGFSPASLIVLADNDYYSEPRQMESAERLTSGPPLSVLQSESHEAGSSTETPPTEGPRPRFRHFGTTISGAHKTGLGSSAAIVTALTAALLSHYLGSVVFDVNSDEGKRILHNLAQIAHCSAQGKIGSGFDVASAVYGSCVYRRFSPSLISKLPSPGQPGFGSALVSLVNQGDWDCEINKDMLGKGLPSGLAIRMCDVDCGTQTVGMVKKVHEWKSANPDRAEQTYNELQHCVDHLASIIRHQKIDEIGTAMRPLRDLMRRMGNEAGAQIEPETQEAMLNELEKVPGVYGTVVPGAGGYDAAAVVMKDDAETEKRVKEFLRSWSKEKGIQVRLLRVKGETQGVRTEDVKEFASWLYATN